jgi:hypothetical protein
MLQILSGAILFIGFAAWAEPNLYQEEIKNQKIALVIAETCLAQELNIERLQKTAATIKDKDKLKTELPYRYRDRSPFCEAYRKKARQLAVEPDRLAQRY